MAKHRGHNEGSIFQQPNGKWRAQVSIQGKRQSSTFKAKEECRTWIRQMLEQEEQGHDYTGSLTTLKEFLQQWLETAQLSLRPKTFIQYQALSCNHIIPHIGLMKLKDLRQDKVEEYYAGLISQGIGPRTVQMIHSILHRAMEKAVRYGLLLRNPVHGASLPKWRPPEMQVFDDGQVNQFLMAARGSNYEALYHLAIVTGMRQGELFGLKWIDVQWQTGSLHIRRQVQSVPGQGWVFSDPKTRAGKRVVLIGEGTLKVLRVHKQRQQQQIALAGDRWKNHDLIFTSGIGTPLNPSNLRLDFNRVLDQAGLHRIRFHDLRHTTASLMLNHNIPVIVASRRLGHSKPSVTLDIYGHLYHEMQGEAAKVMDELVTPVAVEGLAKVKVPRE